MTQEPKMCTHVSEFVPSPRQPLIVQKIAAVGASGDRVSEGDGAHTQQGGAQHLRTHNNSGERGHRIRLRDTAIASENHGRLSPASHRADGRGASPLNRKMFGFFFFLVFCCCCCCSPLPCGINRSPDCMCSLPFSVTSNSSPLSLSLSLSLSPHWLSVRSGKRERAWHRARALRPPPHPLFASPQCGGNSHDGSTAIGPPQKCIPLITCYEKDKGANHVTRSNYSKQSRQRENTHPKKQKQNKPRK